MRSILMVLPALLALGSVATAQQSVGISVAVTLSGNSGVFCGFDCTAATNNGQLSASVGDSLDVGLLGEPGLPGALAIGIGPALSQCPGVTLPGIANSLQILPSNLLVALTTPPLNAGRTICRTAGLIPVVQGLAVPASASGLTLTWQGLVFDTGAPAFTRAVDLSVR